MPEQWEGIASKLVRDAPPITEGVQESVRFWGPRASRFFVPVIPIHHISVWGEIEPSESIEFGTLEFDCVMLCEGRDTKIFFCARDQYGRIVFSHIKFRRTHNAIR
jgi:hypothetical protein